MFYKTGTRFLSIYDLSSAINCRCVHSFASSPYHFSLVTSSLVSAMTRLSGKESYGKKTETEYLLFINFHIKIIGLNLPQKSESRPEPIKRFGDADLATRRPAGYLAGQLQSAMQCCTQLRRQGQPRCSKLTQFFIGQSESMGMGSNLERANQILCRQ